MPPAFTVTAEWVPLTVSVPLPACGPPRAMAAPVPGWEEVALKPAPAETLMLPLPVSPTLTPPSVVSVVLTPVRVMVPLAPAERPSTMLAEVPLPELTLTKAPPDRARLPVPASPTSKPPVVVVTVAPLTFITPLAPAL